MTVVGFAAIGIFHSKDIPKGNPDRLTHAMDYNGSFCGIDNGYSNLRYSYYLANGAGNTCYYFPTLLSHNMNYL